MSLERIIAPLAHVGLFHGLELRQLREIGRIAERVVFEPEQVIASAGAAAEAAYLTVRGRAAVSREPGLPREELAPGTLIGELAMLIETTFLVTVVALGPVKALRLPRAGLLGAMEQDPRIAEHLAGKMADRLKSLSAELKAVERSFGGSGIDGSDHASATPRSQRVEASLLNPLNRALNIGSSDDVTLSR